MRLIQKDIDRDGSGAITVYPEQPEDMWHTFNMIQVGDQIKAPTVRRVTTQSSTGSSTSQKVRMTLTISVVKVDFDSQASELHINGTVCIENQHVKMGAHHTLDLELHRNFTIAKREWDAIALDRISLACDPAKTAEIGAVVLQEGLAHICLLTEYMTINKLRIEQSVARKVRGSSTAHEKGLNRFYDTVYEGMKKYFFEDDRLKVILIASPGFVGEGLVKKIMNQAVLDDRKDIIRAKPKLLQVHCSSGHLFSLDEVLKSPEVLSQLSDTKFAKETQTLDKFYRMMNDDEFRAWYGPDHVAKAVDAGAVGTLLVTDALFRSDDLATRKKYVTMVEDVKTAGGQVLIFSSLHESGKQLSQIGEIAAILTIPLTEEDLGLE